MRALFGGDPMLTETNGIVRLNKSSRTLTFYDAETGGAQVTDLLDGDGTTAISTVTTTGAVVPPFYGPDNVTLLWADAGDGNREPMRGAYESTALSATIDEKVEPKVDPLRLVQRGRAGREVAARWSLVDDGLSTLQTSGLTTTGGYIAATVGGTDGNAIFPVWGRTSFRASFKVKVTKSTVGSKSGVGFTTSVKATLPATNTFIFAVGYLQGTGLCFIRDNVGGPVVLVADSSLVDGAEYDVAIFTDTDLAAGGGATTGAITCRITDSAGVEQPLGLSNFSLTSFPANNLLVRTNVAAGSITDLVMVTHPTAPIGTPGLTKAEIVYAGAGAEKTYLRIPANPNGKLVIACHGHGGTPVETGQSSSLYRDTWNTLNDAGFVVAVPNMGGNLWGNDTAQAYLAELHSLLTTRYDLDPECYLWGTSMGGGAALTAIAKTTVPVRAAVLTQAAADLESLSTGSLGSSISAAYPTVAERDANDPMKFPAAAYADVPMLFTASPSDTTVPKATNTDAFRTKLGTTVPNYLITVTGNHADPSHFRAQDTLNFFRANM